MQSLRQCIVKKRSRRFPADRMSRTINPFEMKKDSNMCSAKLPLPLIALAVATLFNGCTVTSEQSTPQAEMIEGFLAGSAVRYAVQDYVIEHGRLPASNQDLGLPEPQAYARGALSSVAVGERGRITLTFNERSGVDDGTIQLVPIASDPLYGVQWDCKTPSFEDIQSWAPACRFAPGQR
ncbi:MAG: hypothetical protein CME36_15720 [unclassified Hahellaceae]|nr:hypothetical protein [Hahellaceae bacterium]|tara:strand:- start:73123 stop:73662 length:540 start_codon:yes stop_codon:yes gene_type:complete